MNTLTQVAAVVGALAYIGAAPVEMFFFERPWAQQFLHVATRDVEHIRLWAFSVGARNLIVGVGTIVGVLIYHRGDPVVGEIVTITAVVYQLLAGLSMGVSDALGLWRPRGGSVNGTIATCLPALVALVAFAW
jgi:putative membrane protein